MIPGSTVVFVLVYFAILSYYYFVDVDLGGTSGSYNANSGKYKVTVADSLFTFSAVNKQPNDHMSDTLNAIVKARWGRRN